MKNPIIEGIETAIAAHKAELKKYEAMLALYHSGPSAEHYNPRRDAQVRRHATKQIEVSGTPTKRKLIIALMADGEKRTVSEMVNAIYPTRNGTTKRILKNSVAAVLVEIHKEKLLTREEGENGKYVYWKNGSTGNMNLRGPRGPYKKKRKNAAPVISRSFKDNLPSPDWRTAVPNALQGMNPLTAREITEKIAPGIHKKTRRVLAARCSAMLVWLKKEGVVKEVRDADGVHVKYTI
jgi:hypothetical protein